MTTYACTACDFIGFASDFKPATVPRLQPGEAWVAPLGVCPECKVVVPHDAPTLGYPKTAFDWNDGRQERANLSTFQRACLLKALAALVPEHPGFLGAPEIAYVLNAFSLPLPPEAKTTFGTACPGPYLRSWVIPLLVGALYGPVYMDQRESVIGEGGVVRSKMQAAALEGGVA